MRHQQERKAGKVDIGRLDEALAQQAEREGVVRIDPIGIGAALAAGGNCYVSPPPYTLCGASAGYSTIAFRLRPGSGAVTLLRTWDSDHDGTLRLYEVPSAASAEFDKLDVDHEGSLSPQELGGRLTRRDFNAADKDDDSTLSKEEYLALVVQRFRAAAQTMTGRSPSRNSIAWPGTG